MRKWHLIELHEQPWMPAYLRRMTPSFLTYILKKFSIYTPCADLLASTIYKTKSESIVDFCSGAGGNVLHVHTLLREEFNLPLKLNLSDLFPDPNMIKKINTNASNNIYYQPMSTNVLKPSPSTLGLRTLFTSFHHFKPKQAKHILNCAASNNDPIAIFEFTENRFFRLLFDLLTPFIVFLIMPMLKELGWKRFLFTYLIPITPFMIAWDGFVSNLRSYSTTELLNISNSVDKPHYHWQSGKIKSNLRFFNITYLIGSPK